MFFSMEKNNNNAVNNEVKVKRTYTVTDERKITAAAQKYSMAVQTLIQKNDPDLPKILITEERLADLSDLPILDLPVKKSKAKQVVICFNVILASMKYEQRLIIFKEYISHSSEKWWISHLSQSNYYRSRAQAVANFNLLCNI